MSTKKILIILLVIALLGGSFFFLQKNDELQGRIRNRAPLLSVTTNTNTTFASPQAGDQDVTISPIDLTCSDASKCVLTRIQFQGYLDSDGDGVFTKNPADTTTNLADLVSNLYLMDDTGTVLSSETEVDRSNFTLIFSGLTYEIANNSSKTLYVVGDLGSFNNTTGFWGISFGTTSASDVEGHDPLAGRSLTIRGASNPEHLTVTTGISISTTDEYETP